MPPIEFPRYKKPDDKEYGTFSKMKEKKKKAAPSEGFLQKMYRKHLKGGDKREPPANTTGPRG